MRHVLVPLDGTDLAAAIVPDARRLAGRDGELILIRNVAGVRDTDAGSPIDRTLAIDAAQVYLDTVAQTLRADGMRVRTQPLVLGDAAVAIDEGAEMARADVIAVSTHGRSAVERWRSGSVAWRALLRSRVPILIRHVDPERPFDRPPHFNRRHIMVPLDGSALAEEAVPLARDLAREWDASITLVRAVDDAAVDAGADHGSALTYLQEIARSLPGDAHTAVLDGSPVQTLARAQQAFEITDVVMTSHGRTAVSRAIVGSVLDDLIHTLRCPFVVVPILAAMLVEGEKHGVGFGFSAQSER